MKTACSKQRQFSKSFELILWDFYQNQSYLVEYTIP